MHRSQLMFSLEGLQKLFNLPDDVYIASVQQRSVDGCVAINILSERDPPMTAISDGDPKKIGYAYEHPEKFQEDTSKGYIRGADSPKE